VATRQADSDTRVRVETESGRGSIGSPVDQQNGPAAANSYNVLLTTQPGATLPGREFGVIRCTCL